MDKKYTEDEQKKAAYALNMCTVSVAQIIDYNDAYILEQEYDAILNNLNLEQIPDDEAFLNILVELLNTITFFRIQDKRKDMLDRQYQKRIKNAIWSAIPNVGLIVAGGNPATMLFSLATQIGSGYMNYRKEKSNILSDKEKAELELEISAIEQFNAIRRELFTTAWRIAKEYKFPDSYRLTEKQIEQYNKIMMDEDEERKFIRLEAIRENFTAYPPYWYQMGHAAAYLAGMNQYKLAQSRSDEAEAYTFSEDEKHYLEKAKEYFGKYEEMNKYNILREDQLTAAFALEYVDVLMLENEKDTDKIKGLLGTARKMSGCAYDVMQLCAVGYLKIGELSEAAVILKQLVNEKYNMSVNAKLLSRIYVSQYLNKEKPQYGCGKETLSYDVKSEYKLLANRVDERYLFHMPESIESDVKKQDERLQEEYVSRQKQFLIAACRKAIAELEYHMTVEYNKVLFPSADRLYDEKFFEATDESGKMRKQEAERIGYDVLADRLKKSEFEHGILNCLNRTVNLFDTFSIFRKSKRKDDIVRSTIRKNVFLVMADFQDAQEKIEQGKFDENVFDSMQKSISYRALTSEFWDKARTMLFESIEQETDLSRVEETEGDLLSLCEREHLPKPEIAKENTQREKLTDTLYFEYEIFGENSADEKKRDEMIKELEKLVEKAKDHFAELDPSKVKFITRKDNEFELYFENVAFRSKEKRWQTVAILDDRTPNNDDFLFTVDGLVVISQNRESGQFGYDEVTYKNDSHGNDILLIGDKYEFSNNKFMFNMNVDIKALKKLIDDIKKLS